MDLEAIKKRGGFVDPRLVPVTKVWKRYDEEAGDTVEEEVKFFVRQASYVATRQVMSGQLPADEDAEHVGPVEGRPDPEALMVAACICLGDKGQERLSYQQACMLEPSLFGVFLSAVQDVYGSGAADPKASPRPTSSGAKSSKPGSGAARSRKPRKR